MTDTLALLLLPLQVGFMREALLAAALVAVPAGLLSPFLVLKGWSLMGDAVSHAVLPGIVLASVAGLPVGLGAFAAGMLCALAAGYLRENSRLKGDTVLGVVFSGMFGLGIVLHAALPSGVHLDHVLFGNVLGVSEGDLLMLAVVAVLVALVFALRWRDLLLHSFDAGQARAAGLPVRVLHYGLLAVLSLTVVAALQAAGIVLTVALLIAPGAIAFLLTRRFQLMLAVSLGTAVFAALAGVYLSFFLDSAPAPTIVLVLASLFLLAFGRARWLAAGAQRVGTGTSPR